MATDSRLNDQTWRKIFEKSQLLKEIEKAGHAYISAKDMKRLGDREPRLLAKLDSLSDRPAIFQEHDLNILPVERGRYVIFSDPENRSYYQFASDVQDVPPTSYTSALELEAFDSLPKKLAYTEFQAIDVAHLSSLLSTFCNQGRLELTLRGRMSSGEFSFQLPASEHVVTIHNAQMEIDSAYEAVAAVPVVEAKIGLRKDFLVRQLQYPYIWLSSVTPKKIIPILLCYSNGQFQLNEFSIGKSFGEFTLTRQQSFVINEPSVATINCAELFLSIQSGPEPAQIPFPQADDMNKVIDLTRLFDQGVSEIVDITSTFGFVDRQAYYYVDAAKYLGFVEGKSLIVRLTPAGLKLARERSRNGRTRQVLVQMLRLPVFRECLTLLQSREFDLEKLPKETILGAISRYRSDITGDTISRRTLTVRNWLKWIVASCRFV